jgi:hypothetical protein
VLRGERRRPLMAMRIAGGCIFALDVPVFAPKR